MRHTKESGDIVVLYYKLMGDILAKKCTLIRQAARKTGASDQSLPETALPSVRVTKAAPRSMSDLLTKVDLSFAHNHALLSQDDLIYSYNGRLVETVEQLQNETAKTLAKDQVQVGVLRRVKTTNNHPMMGVADKFVWQPLHIDIGGGPIAAKLETLGGPRKHSQDPKPAPAPAQATAGAAESTLIRFACSVCGKQLKCTAESTGKKVKCPKCRAAIQIP
jgi:hypothetical protein